MWNVVIFSIMSHFSSDHLPCVEIVRNLTQTIENTGYISPGSADSVANSCKIELETFNTCIESITWLQNQGKTEMEACYQIGQESKCTSCSRNINLPPSPPPFPPSLPSPPFFPSSASCLSHYTCVRKGLNGQCCPGEDGNYLDCCESISPSFPPLNPSPLSSPLPLNPPPNPDSPIILNENTVWNSLSISLLVLLVCSIFIILSLLFCNLQLRISVVEDAAVENEGTT